MHCCYLNQLDDSKMVKDNFDKIKIKNKEEIKNKRQEFMNIGKNICKKEECTENINVEVIVLDNSSSDDNNVIGNFLNICNLMF